MMEMRSANKQQRADDKRLAELKADTPDRRVCLCTEAGNIINADVSIKDVCDLNSMDDAERAAMSAALADAGEYRLGGGAALAVVIKPAGESQPVPASIAAPTLTGKRPGTV